MQWRWNDEPLFDDVPIDGSRCPVWTRVADALARRWPDAWADVVLDGPTGLRGIELASGPDGVRPAWIPAAPDCGAVADCFADGAPVRVDAPSGTDGGMVVLGIACPGGVRKAIRVARPGPIPDADLTEGIRLAEGVAGRLRERHATIQARLSADLAELPMVADGSQSVAAAALGRLTDAVGASAGALLVDRGGRLHVLADVGAGAIARREALASGLPRGTGLAWRALLDDVPVFASPYADSGAALPDLPIDPHVSVTPIGRRDAPRWVLALSFPEAEPPYGGDLALIRGVAPVLATALERAATIEAEERMISLQERLPDLPTQALHPLLLETAIESVPGADAGALLAREAEGDAFVFRATLGYDLGALDDLRVGDAEARAWYDPEGATWGEAAPRVLATQGGRYLRMARRIGLGREAGLDASLGRVRADLTVPVRVGTSVDALLVLHSATRATAFGRDSVRMARQWSLTARTLLRVAHDRDRARRDAVTDALTGLLNRRGAEMELHRALARAERADQPVAVVVIDLGAFKAINDRFGHAAGDRALNAAADALRRTVRAGDVVARWGGDEFLAILPQQGHHDASRTGRRIAEALATVREGGRRLVAHVGIASFPTDALAADQLLRLADRRMYREKHGRDGAKAPEAVRG